MNAQQLKNAILQEAIEGRLVPQDPNDEPASILLERIHAEKERLVKEGKLKKKDLEVKPISEDEIPFEIPESWEWVRLKSIGITETGTTPSKSFPEYFGKYIPFLGPANILNDIIVSETQGLSEIGMQYGRVVPANSILQVCIGGSIGKCAITNKPVTFNQQINSITPIDCSEKYIHFVLQSRYFVLSLTDNSTGTATPIINRGNWEQLLIPLPPLAEQQRIVAKIEELLPKVEKYGKAQGELKKLNEELPERLKKSILQEAIEGRLVSQDTNDEPASVLLEKIREEKKQLVKAGKLKKKDTKDTPISEDEIPFDIPDSWEWVRLENITTYISRGKSPVYSEIQKYPIVAQKCNQWSGFSLEKAKFADPKTIDKYADERLLRDGDLLWNSTGLGTLGRMAIYDSSVNQFGWAAADSHVTVIRTLPEFSYYKYLYYYFASNEVQSVIEDKSDGSTKQKELSQETVRKYLVPLPPLAEQKRIVAKIEQLLGEIDKLKKKE